MGVNMEKRHFYFVKDEFYNALPDCYLMTNKGLEGKGGRPCHYCFESRDFFWMIPISSTPPLSEGSGRCPHNPARRPRKDPA